MMELTVQSLEHFDEVCVLRLGTPASMPQHIAGQYAVLQFGEFPPRPYSVANSPNGQYLEFHIKNSMHGGGSTYATHNLNQGDKVTWHRFGGKATYRADCDRPILLIAGGTGLSPMLAILEASFAQKPDRDVALFYGARHKRDLYFDAVLQDLQTRNAHFFYTPVLSEEQLETIPYGIVGDFALNHCSVHIPRIYMAGPVDMLRTTQDIALAKGVSPDVIHSDLEEMLALKPKT